MNKAVFLDRDGVINEVLSDRVRFVNHPKELYLLPGVGEAIKQLNEAGFYVFVVTNQGGVGLGYLKESMLIKIHDRMIEEISAYGGKIDGVAFCPHKPKAGCDCRKPGSKMITDFAENHHISLRNSYMVGDRDVDIEAGIKAGVKTILVGGDHYEEADQHAADLPDAVKLILKK